MTFSIVRTFIVHLRGLLYHHRVPLLATLALLITGSFILQNTTEVTRISRTVSGANPSWVVAALLAQLLVIGFAGLSYKVVMQKLGYTLPWPGLANLHLRRHVVATVTPIGGPASVYVFVRSLQDRGVSTPDAVFGAVIRSLAGYTSFVLLLLPVLIVSRPAGIILVGAAALVVFFAALVTMMTALLRESFSPAWLMIRLPQRVRELIQQARSHHFSVRDLGAPFGLAIIHNLLGVATLYLCLLAVGQHPSLAIPLAGYAIGTLFMMVAPVFQGLGVVELTMALALQQLGIPAPAAIAATILFRLSDLWFPFALGVCTHAANTSLVRRAAVRTPATALGALGLLAIAIPFAPASLLPNIQSASRDVPNGLVLLVLMIGGAWCVALSYALWRRRPLAQALTLNLMAISVSAIVVQSAESLDLPLSIIQVVTTLLMR